MFPIYDSQTKLISAIAFPFLFLFIIGPVTAGADQPVIIGFHDKPGSAEEALLRDQGGKIKHRFRHIPAYAASLSNSTKRRLQNNPKVKYIVDDIPYTLIEPAGAAASDLEYANSWGVSHIGSEIAHANGITGEGIRIALLDTGIDYTHPELAANYKGGWDFAFNDNDPLDDSWNSHGTHVAGIIGASADGNGVVGVAPDAELYAVKVLDGAGFGLLSWIIEGIEWSVDAGMDLINISIGGLPSEPLEEACNIAYNAGVLVIAAAGNGAEVAFPAGYDSVIAVTGTDQLDQPGWFAPYGPQVELGAPGVLIQSTITGSNYGELSGTSQAAPHVTGLAALIYSSGSTDLNHDGIVDNKDVRLQMQHGAVDLGDSGRDGTYGFGLVDVAGSLDLGGGTPNEMTFDLTRNAKSSVDHKIIQLPAADSKIVITNTSLVAVRVLVYENGSLRKDLSEMFHFVRNSSQVAEMVISAVDAAMEVVFVPIGKPGATSAVTIISQPLVDIP